jgi:hypothetical protein
MVGQQPPGHPTEAPKVALKPPRRAHKRTDKLLCPRSSRLGAHKRTGKLLCGGHIKGQVNCCDEWSASNRPVTRPRPPKVAFTPPRSQSGDPLRARTAHSQFEDGSTAWKSLWSKAESPVVIFRPPISVPSTQSSTHRPAPNGSPLHSKKIAPGGRV